MELIIRDDDLSYFAEPQYLNQLFSGIWEHTPVHFAVIPYVYTKQVETPLGIDNEKDFYWIGDNSKLVEYLKKKINEDKVIIWQHGFTHKDENNCYEFECRDRKKLYENIKYGKEHLEKTFNVKVDTFVAPHDRFSKEAIEVLEELGFKYICRGFSPLPREIRMNKLELVSVSKLLRHYLRYGTKFKYPYKLEFKNHVQIYSYRIQEIKGKHLKTQVRKLKKFHKGGTLCVVTHYRNMNLAQKEILNYLVENVIQNKK